MRVCGLAARILLVDDHVVIVLGNASDPSLTRVGAVVVAGRPSLWSVVRITAVDSHGQVHLLQLDRNNPATRALLASGA